MSLVAPSAFGAAIYDSGGFETPRFTDAAQLQGQDIALGPWLKDPGIGTATVTTANPATGSHSVFVTRPANAAGDTRWAVVKPLLPTPGLNVFEVESDVRVEQATFSGSPPNNTDFGPIFGLEAYDSSIALSPKLIGSVTIDATTGDVLYQATGSGVLTETGTIVSRGAYHHLKLALDFAASQYRVYVDNALLRTEPFVDPGVTAFTDAPISALAASVISLPTGTGSAYFDNYSINLVPEPTGIGAVAVAFFGLTARRRRTAAVCVGS